LPREALALISPEYKQAALALQVLSVSALANSVGLVSVSTLNGINKPRHAMVVSVLAAVTVLATTSTQVHSLQMTGAAIGYAAEATISASAGLAGLRIWGRLHISYRRILAPIISVLGALAAGYIARFMTNSGPIAYVLAAIAFAILVLTTKSVSVGSLRNASKYVLRPADLGDFLTGRS
jgi:O-antigen/teichoic acid export membrane protein